jgi:hypothetical protein
MSFEKPQGLGGHISKAHPGKSKVYSQKMITRKLRQPQRDLLENAKNLLYARDPNFDIKNNRSTLNSLKRVIK